MEKLLKITQLVKTVRSKDLEMKKEKHKTLITQLKNMIKQLK